MSLFMSIFEKHTHTHTHAPALVSLGHSQTHASAVTRLGQSPKAGIQSVSDMDDRNYVILATSFVCISGSRNREPEPRLKPRYSDSGSGRKPHLLS